MASWARHEPKRMALATKIATEWKRRNYDQSNCYWEFFWKEMEAFAVEVLQEAYDNGYKLSKSQYNPVWNSAMTVAYDAYNRVW